ncbi:replication initiation protein [Hydrocarboniclastica marina]|uniref:Replication initiation protein n=1 Tax=Hydrocarboniclastica marina TaxID=2259620 RepID=A0A4P7XMF0_9ALTE|nr:replication initiation protein [Hydrocarboniclastica marina]QCF28123.1 replication initiation protein [Hydrocarboniclastica marina]
MKESERKLIVKKSNELIDAGFELTLNESRIILYCVSQILPKQPIKADEMYFVHAKAFSELFHLDLAGVYKTLKKAMLKLGERWATVTDKNGDPKEIRWIITRQYFENQGVLGLQFHPDMLPYISELKKHFTQYDIKFISRMSSAYGIPIYELLTKRRDLKKQSFSIDALKQKLKLEGRYPAWRDFKRYVLEPAIRDLNNEYGEFKASYETIKEGRAITAVTFKYEPRRKSLPLWDREGNPAVEKPKKSWEEYGYRSDSEYREALELAKRYDFDVNNVSEFLKARVQAQRDRKHSR